MAEHESIIPTELQQEVFDLVHDRLGEIFGAGGSFRVTLGRATAEDAMFVDTVAETIAWQVAAALSAPAQPRSQHAADEEPRAEHEALWAHVERELVRRRHADDTAEQAGSLPTHIRAA